MHPAGGRDHGLRTAAGLGKAEEVGRPGLSQLAGAIRAQRQQHPPLCEIVRERSILRKLVSASDEIATAAFNTQGKPVDKILDDAEQKIFNIGEEGSRMKQGFQGMDSLVVQLLDRVQEYGGQPNDITGVPTGFLRSGSDDLGHAGRRHDRAGRTTLHGKTGPGDQHCRACGAERGPAGCRVLDGNGRQPAGRAYRRVDRADRPDAPAHSASSPTPSGRALTEAIEKLRNISLHIDENTGLTVSELRANSRRLARQLWQAGPDRRGLTCSS